MVFVRLHVCACIEYIGACACLRVCRGRCVTGVRLLSVCSGEIYIYIPVYIYHPNVLCIYILGVFGECTARDTRQRLAEGSVRGAGGPQGAFRGWEAVGRAGAAQAEGERPGPAGVSKAGIYHINMTRRYVCRWYDQLICNQTRHWSTYGIRYILAQALPYVNIRAQLQQ